MTVRNALCKTAASLQDPPDYSTVEYVAGARVDEQSISLFLDLSGAPEENLINPDVPPPSCEWLAKKD